MQVGSRRRVWTGDIHANNEALSSREARDAAANGERSNLSSLGSEKGKVSCGGTERIN